MSVGDALTVFQAATLAHDNRKKLLSSLRKLHYCIRHGKMTIAIFGAGGTGKSTLGKLLSVPPDKRYKSLGYKTSIGIEPYSLDSEKIVCNLLVAPGQEVYLQPILPELLRKLINDKIGMVIDVVSWGYHSFEPESYQASPHFQAGMNVKEFMAAYVVARRKEEMKVIAGLKTCLTNRQGKLKMITLVTKQDLWWDYREAALAHYQSGVYNGHIGEIRHALGERNFEHQYLPVSLIKENMRTIPGELLCPTTGGYDDSLQQASVEKLIATIVEMASR